jgi:DNA polymerase III alpha subunit (gram-positive type)
VSKSKTKPQKEYYISVDVETDGPCPGVNSMLQLGAVFYSAEGEVLKELGLNLFELEGAVQDPHTMAWWADQEVRFPGIWDRLMENRLTPKLAMERFTSAVQSICHQTSASPVVVGYPAGFDFSWLYYYLHRMTGKSCVGFSALDLKTLGMSLINRTYHDSVKHRFPREWFNPQLKHTHNALDDARGQGYMFFRMKEAASEMWANSNPVKAAQSQVIENT